MVEWAFRWSSATVVVILLYVLIYSIVNAFNYSGFGSDLAQNQQPSMSSGSITANIWINSITAVLMLILVVVVWLDH